MIVWSVNTQCLSLQNICKCEEQFILTIGFQNKVYLDKEHRNSPFKRYGFFIFTFLSKSCNLFFMKLEIEFSVLLKTQKRFHQRKM